MQTPDEPKECHLLTFWAKWGALKAGDLKKGTVNMTSSLHVSLPDEMRDFVDRRTDGKHVFSTPSEYVRALIREDMEKEAEKLYVYKELLKSAADIKAGRIYPASVLKQVNEELDKELDEEFD